MKGFARKAGRAATLLNLRAWLRRQAFLLRAYRLLPTGLRAHVSGLFGSRVSAGARFERTAAWQRPVADENHSEGLVEAAGVADVSVNVIGYIRGQFGLAESARMYARALIGAGAGVRLYDVDLGLPHGWDDHSLDAWISEDVPHRTCIVFVNPDYLQQALDSIGRERLAGRYLIACWFWELERVPDDWLPAIEQVDEILVATRFVEQAFRKVTSKAILRVPLPLAPVSDSGLERADFALEEGKFIFLASFDFNSWIERKNPRAVMEAFRLAFGDDRDDVRLLIKTSNGFRYPEQFHSLLRAASSDPRIMVRDEILEREHVRALQRCCDAYVSLHRAEGFGLGLAEAMSIGKPVIGTAWSGNVDFMNADNSCLVDYTLVPVPDDGYPGGGERWAEADAGHAASFMRRLVDEPGYAATLGANAARDILETNSLSNAGRIMVERLRQIGCSVEPGSVAEERGEKA